MTSCSDRGLTTTFKSPPAMRSATPVISFMPATIRSNASASTPISSLRDVGLLASPVCSPLESRLAMPTTCPRAAVISRMMSTAMMDTTSRPITAHASATRISC